MFEKLKRSGGETLVETLFAILIVTLSVLFLTTATVSAARINRGTAEEDTAFRRAESAESGGITVTVKKGAEVLLERSAELYITGQESETDKDEYRYYRLRPGED